jgi:tRNA (cmo5U34)-methyltransferase
MDQSVRRSIGLEETSFPGTVSGKWEFDDHVTNVFEDMLRRSIPQYEAMRRTVFDLGSRFVQRGTDIVDIGASRGDALAPFVARFQRENRYTAVEVSPPMLGVMRERFREGIDAGLVRVLDLDVRTAYPDAHASLTLCVLTLQFTPTEYRQRILRDAFTRTVPGGVLILVEKILGASAELNAAMVELYHDGKHQHGYSHEEIERKRMALEGVLVPITAQWNEQLLRGAGFSDVDCFWRWMNFAGWIARKP